jgi:hypothetical protein
MDKATHTQFCTNEVYYLVSYELPKFHNNQNIVMIQMQIANL